MNSSQQINNVCAALGVRREDLTSCRRSRNIADARQMAFKILREDGHTVTDIAARFGRTHATVIHGIRAISEKIANERKLAFAYNTIKGGVQ